MTGPQGPPGPKGEPGGGYMVGTRIKFRQSLSSDLVGSALESQDTKVEAGSVEQEKQKKNIQQKFTKQIICKQLEQLQIS